MGKKRSTNQNCKTIYAKVLNHYSPQHFNYYYYISIKFLIRVSTKSIYSPNIFRNPNTCLVHIFIFLKIFDEYVITILLFPKILSWYPVLYLYDIKSAINDFLYGSSLMTTIFIVIVILVQKIYKKLCYLIKWLIK